MRRKILGVNIDFDLSMEEAIDVIDRLIVEDKKSHLIATTNPFFIMTAQEDAEFKKILNQASLSLPDGVGVLYAKYYLDKIKKLKKDPLFKMRAFFAGIQSGLEGYTNKEDFGSAITGVSITEGIFKLANEKNYTLFLLGGRKRDKHGRGIDAEGFDMAENVSHHVMSKYPNIRLIGATSKFSRKASADKNTQLFIHNCMLKHKVTSIDILLVAYNPIEQEKWIHRNASKIPSRISVGIGRTFDYLDNVMRKPNIIYERMHLAWLYTFIRQPWRYKRIIKTFPIFPLKVYKQSIKS